MCVCYFGEKGNFSTDQVGTKLAVSIIKKKEEKKERLHNYSALHFEVHPNTPSYLYFGVEPTSFQSTGRT